MPDLLDMYFCGEHDFECLNVGLQCIWVESVPTGRLTVLKSLAAELAGVVLINRHESIREIAVLHCPILVSAISFKN